MNQINYTVIAQQSGFLFGVSLLSGMATMLSETLKTLEHKLKPTPLTMLEILTLETSATLLEMLKTPTTLLEMT